MNCPTCQTENPPDARFCASCGSELSNRCANCQADLAPDARFCMYCGHPVRAGTSVDDALLTRLASSTPEPLAQKVRAAAEIVGERRVVTVLFVDVVGSSVLSEQLDVEAWSQIMNGAFERITPAIHHYEGTIARLMGDALVAFFGAPVAHEDDPVRALRAALDVLESAHLYAGEVKQAYGVDFAMRATLSRGPVVIENIKRDLKYDYTPLGGVVNLAARIKFAAEPMTALLSEEVYRFVEPLFDFRDLGLIDVRDREQQVHVYQVLGGKATPGSLRGIAGLVSPMVGRQAEIDSLMGLCDAVQAGLGRAVLVIGEPGLGKSRLIAEWQAEIARSSDTFSPQWAEGRCLSYGQGLAYHLLQDMLRSLIGVSEAEEDAATREALIHLIDDLFLSGDDAQPDDVYLFLVHLLSLKLDEDERGRLSLVDPQSLQTHYVNALRATIDRLTARRPLVLVLEDMHWADPASVEVLIRLLPMARTHRLLFCLVIRPERDVPGWKLVQKAREILGGGLTEISLGSLNESNSRQLVANLLEIEALEEDMRGLILRRSEGNPFFVEEIVRMLIEQRAIVPTGSGWVATAPINEVDIPENLQGLLMARIDRLPEDDRHTLRVASVVGRQFPVKVLDMVLSDGGESQQVYQVTRDRLNSLEAADLVCVAQVEPELEYLFRHSLVQDAAYKSLLTADRSRLHFAVGEAIEELYNDRLEEFSAMLAHHFGAAGEDKKSTKYCIMAGDAALAAFANPEAEGHYRCALGYPIADPVRAQLLDKLSESLFAQSRFREAIDTWKEAIDVFSSIGDMEGVSHSYARAARSEWHAGDTPASLSLALEGFSAVDNAPESPEKARLLHEVGRANHFNGKPGEASKFCERALEMAERYQVVDVQADTLATMGVLPDIDPDIANTYLEKAIELAEGDGYMGIAARAHHNISMVKIEHYDDRESARQHLLKAAEIHHNQGNVQREIFSYVNAISLSFQLGELDVVEQALVEMKKLLGTMSDPDSAVLEVNVTEASLLLMRGKWVETLPLLTEYQQAARQRGDLQMLNNVDNLIFYLILEVDRYLTPQDIGIAEAANLEIIDIADRGIGDKVGSRCQRGIILLRQGHLEDAHALMDEARSLAGPEPTPNEKHSLRELTSELAIAESRWDDAILSINESAEYDERAGRFWMWARTLITLGDAHASRGQAQDYGYAQDYYRAAHDKFEEIDVETYVQITNRRLKALQDQTLTTILASHKVAQELTQAGKIQSSFLPEEIPVLPGWGLSAVLEPARATSGDYYDFIELPGERLGILIADVTDKGAGAALFMASSRSLIRAFADQFPDQPELVIQATNDRLVLDTHDGLFVTLFYGILDVERGVLSYCNAGHNPPYLFKAGIGEEISELPPTGMTLGIVENESWDRETVQLEPGDVLVMYTDGVTEAENKAGEFYGEERLLQAGRSTLVKGTASAELVQDAVLLDIHRFVGDAESADDITLIVLSSERE